MRNSDDKFSQIRYISSEKISNILRHIEGPKNLIVDQKILKPLNAIISMTTLRMLGVEKVYSLQDMSLESDGTNCMVFIIYSNLISAKLFCDCINGLFGRKTDNKFFGKLHLVLVPRKFNTIIRLFEEEGIYDRCYIYTYRWELIYFAQDRFFSLELPDFFHSQYVMADQSFLFTITKSILTFFLLYGKPDVTISLGRYSTLIHDMLAHYSSLKTVFRQSSNNSDHKLDYLVLVDRDVDFVSTLLRCATYAGLLDEIKDSSDTSGSSNYNSIQTNGGEIYRQIADRHLTDVTCYLKKKAESIQAEYDRSQKMKLNEIKRYVVQELRNITNVKQSLSQHIAACEMIVHKLGNSFEKLRAFEESTMMARNSLYPQKISGLISRLEEYITSGSSANSSTAILRLIALLHITQCVCTADESLFVRKLFLHAFGYHYLTLFHYFANFGFSILAAESDASSSLASRLSGVVIAPKKNSFRHLADKLKQVSDKMTMTDNNDNKKLTSATTDGRSYVFDGVYIPAVCQLIELIIKGAIDERDLDKFFTDAKIAHHTEIKRKSRPTTLKRSMLIYFIGGVTYAEISAFRLIENLTGCEILIAATNLINGNAVCESCLPC